MASFWVGVASREHVSAAVHGGFCQLSHGKDAPVRRLKRGDFLIFYSPHERMGDRMPLQAFTAIGEITDDVPFQVEQTADFHPYRRKTQYLKVRAAPIQDLLSELSFTKGTTNWGAAFRKGVFKISHADFSRIASAMGARVEKTKNL